MRNPTKSTVSRLIKLNIGAVLCVVVFLVTSAVSTPTHAQAPDQATPAATQAAPAAPPAKGRGFVGQVQGSEAFIALQVADNQVTVFVCDGTKTSISYWHWFTGPLDSGSVEVTAPDGESLVGQLAGDSFTGSVTLGDKQAHNFTATLASGSAGLVRNDFTIDGVDYVGGWIVLPDGQVRGGMADKKGTKKPIIAIIAILIG